jgi:hypothetical protein
MNQPTTDFENRQNKALQRYDNAIGWYRRAKDQNRHAYQILQVCVIVFSGLTPILILMSDVPKPLQALPAALAAILAGVMATFHVHDNYVRFGHTCEAMQSEVVKYETQAAPEYGPDVDEQTRLERFVRTMERTIMSEVTGWRQTGTAKEERQNQ